MQIFTRSSQLSVRTFWLNVGDKLYLKIYEINGLLCSGRSHIIIRNTTIILNIGRKLKYLFNNNSNNSIYNQKNGYNFYRLNEFISSIHKKNVVFSKIYCFRIYITLAVLKCYRTVKTFVERLKIIVCS